MADWGKANPDGKYWNKELETLPREQLEAKQLEDLKEIVKFAYENSPYYKRSFDEAGVKPEDIKTLKDIQKFPYINKKNTARYTGRRFIFRRTCCCSRRGCSFCFNFFGFNWRSNNVAFYKTRF